MRKIHECSSYKFINCIPERFAFLVFIIITIVACYILTVKSVRKDIDLFFPDDDLSSLSSQEILTKLYQSSALSRSPTRWFIFFLYAIGISIILFFFMDIVYNLRKFLLMVIIIFSSIYLLDCYTVSHHDKKLIGKIIRYYTELQNRI